MRRICLLLLVAGLTPGCGRSDTGVVAAGEGFRLTRAQVAAEHDRRYGAGAFDRLSAENRLAFLETVIQRELLLREARSALRELPAPARRRLAVGLEDRLVSEFLRQQRESFRPDSAELWRGIDLLARDLKARAIIVRLASADSVRRELARGEPFDQVGRRVLRGIDPAKMDLGWRDAFRFPPQVIEQAFVVERATGEVVGPVRARPGAWFLQIVEFRAFDPTSRPGFRARAAAFLRTMHLRRRIEAMQDSIRTAAGLRLRSEGAAVAGRAVADYLDSLRQALPPGQDLDAWALRPPVWRLDRTQAEMPVAEIEGEPISAAAFVATLQSADTRYWPRGETEAEREAVVRTRLDRWLVARWAESHGLDRSPPYTEAKARLEEEVLLDTWFETALMAGVTVAPEETEAMLTRDPTRWRVHERVEFAAVVFPAGMEEDARRFRDEVAGTDPLRWTEAAERAEEDIEEVQFIRTSEPLEIGRRPDPVSWTPLLEAAAALPAPGVTGPVAAPELGGVAVVRLIERFPSRPVAPEVARAMAEREVRVQKSETKLGELLRRAAGGAKVRKWPERLGAETR